MIVIHYFNLYFRFRFKNNNFKTISESQTAEKNIIRNQINLFWYVRVYGLSERKENISI